MKKVPKKAVEAMIMLVIFRANARTARSTIAAQFEP